MNMPTDKMKFLGLLFVPIIFISLSCGGGENELTEKSSVVATDEDGNTITDNQVRKDVVENGGVNFDPENCDKDSLSDWTNFLGIPYGLSEVHLDTILQNNSGGQYAEDSSTFCWYYKGIERVPVSVWTNARTTQVETIFIEVTSSIEFFKSDVKEAQEHYGLPECDTKWLGMTPKEVTTIMGNADQMEILEDSEKLEIVSLVYDFKDPETKALKSVVNFRFFESQNYFCSMVIVTWFY